MFKVIFMPQTLNQLEAFGTLEELDAALVEVTYALSKNPHAFKSPPKYPNWGVAITRRYKQPGKVIPGLRIYFVINDEQQKVTVLDIQLNPDDPTLHM